MNVNPQIDADALTEKQGARSELYDTRVEKMQHNLLALLRTVPLDTPTPEFGTRVAARKYTVNSELISEVRRPVTLRETLVESLDQSGGFDGADALRLISKLALMDRTGEAMEFLQAVLGRQAESLVEIEYGEDDDSLAT